MLAHDLIGSGSHTIALLHGIGGGRAIWDDARGGTARALAAAGWRVLAFDLPGYGESPPGPDASIGSMAAAVVAALRGLGARPAVLLGHSMGGMVGLEIAATQPQAVGALVLACTSSAFGRPGGDWQEGFVRARLAPLDAGLGMAALARQLVPSMVAPGTGAAVADACVEVMARVPEPTYRAVLGAIAGFDRRESLAGIGVPTLCLSAEHDRTAPPDVMQRMAARLPLGQHQVIAGAGHLANVEQPSAFAQAVIHFLARCGPAAPS